MGGERKTVNTIYKQIPVFKKMNKNGNKKRESTNK